MHLAIPFFMGILFLQNFQTLPRLNVFFYLALIGFIGSILLRLLKIRRIASLYWIGFAGFVLATLLASWRLSFTLPKALEGKPVPIVCDITEISSQTLEEAAFICALQKINHQLMPAFHLPAVKLHWRKFENEKNLQVGDRLQLQVRLKAIHGLQNPGVFDVEAWAFTQGIRATGYVDTKGDNRVLMHSPAWVHPVNTLRQNIAARLAAITQGFSQKRFLQALLLGDRTAFSKEDWQTLRRTGTNHLFAIAGLHIGCIAAIVYLIANFLARCYPRLLLSLPAPIIAQACALSVAIFYSLISGFALPAKRAIIMLATANAALMLRKKINLWHIFATALFIVLVFDPFAVLSESFWLSFFTIFLIVYTTMGKIKLSRIWQHLGAIQMTITVGLLPLLFYFYKEISLITFFANFIAVPWVSFLILPFCLLAMFFLYLIPSLAYYCLLIANVNLHYLLQLLSFLSHWKFATWQFALHSLPEVLCLIVAILCLLTPRGVPLKWLSLFWFASILYKPIHKPPTHAYYLTILDVGQGLSAVVETKNHLLVYDLGGKFKDKYDSGEQVILPFFHYQAIRTIDKLVLSHGDNDHIGGLKTTLAEIRVKEIITSVPEKIANNANLCLAGTRWEWDGVKFEIIYPTTETLHLGNNSSCVIKIDNGYASTLLTGDIEKFAEESLLSSEQALKSTLLIAPHHGSKSSGLKAFIAAVSPSYVIYSAGYLNRYHFPHPAIVAAYQDIGAKSLLTATSGAIQFKIYHDHLDQHAYRDVHRRFWFA